MRSLPASTALGSRGLPVRRTEIPDAAAEGMRDGPGPEQLAEAGCPRGALVLPSGRAGKSRPKAEPSMQSCLHVPPPAALRPNLLDPVASSIPPSLLHLVASSTVQPARVSSLRSWVPFHSCLAQPAPGCVFEIAFSRPSVLNIPGRPFLARLSSFSGRRARRSLLLHLAAPTSYTL